MTNKRIKLVSKDVGEMYSLNRKPKLQTTELSSWQRQKNTTWKLAREWRGASRADGDKAANAEEEKQEWFPGGRAICSEIQLSICVWRRQKTTHWVLATRGSLVTVVRAVSRWCGHQGQNGWGDKGLGGEEWPQQGETGCQRSPEVEEEYQRTARRCGV